MFIRVIRGQAQPGKAEEVGRRWQEFVGSRIQNAPGFRHGYFGADRASNAVVVVSVWDSKPDPAVTGEVQAEFREQVRDLMAGPPTVEEFEVLTQL